MTEPEPEPDAYERLRDLNRRAKTVHIERDGLERVQLAQAGNGSPHDYRRKVGPPPGPAFCLACGSVRQADGSTDARPCRGVVTVNVR